MITLIVSSAPAKLRGYLGRWLYEVHPTVYVGRVNARVRDEIWGTVLEHISYGKAILTYPSNMNEQGFIVRTHNSEWEMVDFEGLMLPMRPINTQSSTVKAGWSAASRRRAVTRRKPK